MDRIAVVGCGGSGKTLLVHHLGTQLDIIPTHLDAIYYDNQWNPLPADAFADIRRELVSADRWIIEGTTPPPSRSGSSAPTS